MKMKVLWIAGLMLAATAGQVKAGVITSPSAVIGNSMGTFSSVTPGTPRLIDQSGLPAFTSGVTDYATYLAAIPTHAVFANSNAWASASGRLTGFLDFDLGSSRTISGVTLWNQGNNQSIQNFTILISNDSTFGSSTNAGTFNALQSLSPSSSVLGATVGQFARLIVNSNYGSTLTTTLGEIAFDTTDSVSPVPEPASIAMWGVGALGMMFARRKRQQKLTA